MEQISQTQTLPRVTTPDGFQVYCAYDKLVEVDDLKPNPRNLNQHSDVQIQMLAQIITHQRWRAPVTVSRQSVLIVRGHARRLSAYEAGTRYVPVEFQDYESDGAEMADLIAELAVLDEQSISKLLLELKCHTDINPELTGYSTGEIEALLAETTEDLNSFLSTRLKRMLRNPKRRPALVAGRFLNCEGVPVMPPNCAALSRLKLSALNGYVAS